MWSLKIWNLWKKHWCTMVRWVSDVLFFFPLLGQEFYDMKLPTTTNHQGKHCTAHASQLEGPLGWSQKMVQRQRIVHLISKWKHLKRQTPSALNPTVDCSKALLDFHLCSLYLCDTDCVFMLMMWPLPSGPTAVREKDTEGRHCRGKKARTRNRRRLQLQKRWLKRYKHQEEVNDLPGAPVCFSSSLFHTQ